MLMIYAANGKQYVVVAVGAKGHPGELAALTLPDVEKSDSDNPGGD